MELGLKLALGLGLGSVVRVRVRARVGVGVGVGVWALLRRIATQVLHARHEAGEAIRQVRDVTGALEQRGLVVVNR